MAIHIIEQSDLDAVQQSLQSQIDALAVPTPPTPPPPQPEVTRAEFDALAARVAVLEAGQVVDPPPPSPPPPVSQRITASRFRLIGGWKLRQEFATGGLAIDFSTMRAYTGGHDQAAEIRTFDLPEMGTGQDINLWPIVERGSALDRFWGTGKLRGLDFRAGKLWVSPRVFYDMNPQNITLNGKDLVTGETTDIPIPLLKPVFGGGFIKGHPTEWLIGCGGYESGQGAPAGPTCAKADGTILLNQANHGTFDFAARERRPANYSAATDTWVALNPRDIDGDGIPEGAWAADVVYGGGVWLPDGLCYWPILGIGDIDYRRQSLAFVPDGMLRSYLYTYDPQTFDGVQFEEWPHGEVFGHEVDSQGRIYLLCRNEWKGGMYKVDPVLKVFEVVS